LSQGVIAVGAISRSVRDRNESSLEAAEAGFHFRGDFRLAGAADESVSDAVEAQMCTGKQTRLPGSLDVSTISVDHVRISPPKRLVFVSDWNIVKLHKVTECRRTEIWSGAHAGGADCIITNIKLPQAPCDLREIPVCTCRCCISVFILDITPSSPHSFRPSRSDLSTTSSSCQGRAAHSCILFIRGCN